MMVGFFDVAVAKEFDKWRFFERGRKAENGNLENRNWERGDRDNAETPSAHRSAEKKDPRKLRASGSRSQREEH
jgi:hypothetical protein